MKLRPYQIEAVEAVIASWKKHRSCILVLPTGCGKTVVFGEIVRRLLAGETDLPRRAMILAHRGELVHQAADKVGRIAGAEAAIEMADLRVHDLFGTMPSIVVSTVQTQNAGRMAKFKPSDFGVLVIDEAHHATAASYRACTTHYLANPACRLLGVTATPDRADEQALGQVFACVAYEYTVTQAVQDGWLVPVKQRFVKVGSLDFSKVSTCAGDFNQGELAEVLEDERNLHEIAAPLPGICGARRGIVFAASVKQADRLCEILNRREIPADRPKGFRFADWICGRTPGNAREDILRRFREGTVQFLVNVGVLTEGFDDAGVEVVVMARPTKSRALYAQMAGRATRPAASIAARLGDCPDAAARRALIAASGKPACTILDFCGNSGRHKLVTMLDILGGKENDPLEEEARRRAKRRCEESGAEADVAVELARSREDILRERAAEERRRHSITAIAKWIETSVDPFDVYDLPIGDKRLTGLRATRLSFKQQQILRERLGVEPSGVSVLAAKELLNEFFWRIENGMATFNQTKYLRTHGFTMPMGKDEASRTISWLKQRANARSASTDNRQPTSENHDLELA